MRPPGAHDHQVDNGIDRDEVSDLVSGTQHRSEDALPHSGDDAIRTVPVVDPTFHWLPNGGEHD